MTTTEIALRVRDLEQSAYQLTVLGYLISLDYLSNEIVEIESVLLPSQNSLYAKVEAVKRRIAPHYEGYFPDESEEEKLQRERDSWL